MFAAATCGKVAPDGQIIADRFEDDVSLAVKGEKGWSLLLGCAHAGLPNIMQRAKDLFAIERLHMVVGGSHLCGVDPEDYGVWFDRLAEFPVEKWRLNHCTGFKAAAAMAARFDDVDWARCGLPLRTLIHEKEAKMIKQFIADAFTDKIFHGNPAAICLPERWPDDKLMQDIASENNLSETAFVVKEDSGWKLRWLRRAAKSICAGTQHWLLHSC